MREGDENTVKRNNASISISKHSAAGLWKWKSVEFELLRERTQARSHTRKRPLTHTDTLTSLVN